MIRLVARRKAAESDVVGEPGHRRGRIGTQLGVAANEPRPEPVLEAEQVVVHEHLTVTVPSGADADRRYRDRVGHHPGDAVGNAFEHDGETPGLGEGYRVVDDPTSGVKLLALHLESTHGVDRLWCQAEVTHHRDLAVENRGDGVESFPTAFEFDRTGTGANQLGRVAHGLLARHVIAHPRQIADDERVRPSAGHCADVMGHVIGADLERVVVAEHDHGEGVADEDHVDPGAVHDPGARRVVRGDHHQG